MDPSIICGIIGAASAIIVSVITAVYNNKLIAYRIEQLENKVDKHNSVIERVYKLERDVAVIEDHIDDGK